MEKLLEVLQEIRPDVDFEKETALIDDQILDSFDMIALVSAFDEHFGITVKPVDLVPENFNSLQAMQSMIERLQNE